MQSSDQKSLDHLIRLILCVGTALDLSIQTQTPGFIFKTFKTKGISSTTKKNLLQQHVGHDSNYTP